MRKKTIKLGERSVVVRELIVQEVREWLQAAESKQDEVNIVDEMLMGEVALNDLMRMTDMTPDDLSTSLPSELEAVMAVCKELNPHFFKLRAWMMSLARPGLAPASAGSIKPSAT